MTMHSFCVFNHVWREEGIFEECSLTLPPPGTMMPLDKLSYTVDLFKHNHFMDSLISHLLAVTSFLSPAALFKVV